MFHIAMSLDQGHLGSHQFLVVKGSHWKKDRLHGERNQRLERGQNQILFPIMGERSDARGFGVYQRVLQGRFF